MVEMDRESAAAWLEDKPREVQVAFAARCALRALPGLGFAGERRFIALGLPVFRALISASVASTASLPEIEAASRKAAGDAQNACMMNRDFIFVWAASKAAEAAADSQDLTTHVVDCMASAERFDHSGMVADGRSHSSFDHSQEFRSAATADAGEIDIAGPAAVFDRPLWHRNPMPPGVHKGFDLLGRLLAADTETWGFWREWYQGMLDGQPMDWELQKRVALIPDADWEKGPEHIARKIEEIESTFLAEKLPQAERIEFNPETARFRAVPIPVEKADLLGATLSQVEDALDDALANPSNGLSDRSREARVLRRTVANYGNDPQRIEMDLTSVHAALTRQIANEDLPPSEENLALQNACAEGARAIRATHPEVAENRTILSEQALRELTPEARAILQEALPVLEAISEEALAEEWRQDIPALINDAIGPVPDTAPRLPGADEATRIFSRAAKIGVLLRIKTVIDRVSESTPYKAATILGTIATLVSAGIALF